MFSSVKPPSFCLFFRRNGGIFLCFDESEMTHMESIRFFWRIKSPV